MLEKNIPIEAGLTSPADANKLLETGLYKKCFRILIEPQEQHVNDAIINISTIEKIINPIVGEQSVLLHGFDNTVWDLLLLAHQKGYDTRIGFEDTIFSQTGRQAKSNAELITKAIKLKTEQ